MTDKTLLMYPKDAREYIGVSQATFYNMTKEEGFPKARYPTGKRPMYLREELDEWAKKLGGRK